MKKHRTSKSVVVAVVVCSLALACGAVRWGWCAAPAAPPSEAEQADPAKDFDAIRKLASSGDHQGVVDKLRAFTVANAAWERIGEANLLLGAELVQAGEVTAGKDVLERLIQKTPGEAQTAEAHFFIAQALEGSGDFPGAVLGYDVVIRRFPKSAVAPEAALREALISEKVLRNPKRAREVYESFVESYPTHAKAAAVRNHLGLMAEQGVAPTGAGQKRAPTPAEFIQDWQIVGPFANVEGKGFDTAYAPEAKVDLAAAYEVGPEQKLTWKPVPKQARLADGGVNLAAAIQPSDNVCAYAYAVFKAPDERTATLYIGSDDTAKVWVNGKLVLSRNVTRGAAPDQDHVPVDLVKGDNTILFKVCNGGGGWGLYARVDYDFAWGPAAAVQFYRRYAAAHPADPGDPAMNGNVAGAAPALWRAAELTNAKLRDGATAAEIYKAYEALPRANKGHGYMNAARLLAANAAAAAEAERAFEAALKASPREDWRLEYARWLRAKQKEDQAAAHFLVIVQYSTNMNYVKDALNHLGPERVRKYLDAHPTDLAVFSYYLSWLKDGEKRAEGRKVLDAWLARADIDWKTVIASQWLAWTKDAQDVARVIRAADAEGRMAQSVAATFRVADAHLGAKAAAEAQAVLTQSLNTWSAYPDYPKGEVAKRLAAVARLEPFKMPNPKKIKPEAKPADVQKAGGGGAAAPAPAKPAPAKPAAPAPPPPPPEPDEIVSPKGVAARNAAIALIRKHKLDADPTGAHALARLHRELDAKTAADDTLKAASLLIDVGRVAEAAEHVAWLVKTIPHDARLVDVLHKASLRGPKGWDKPWKTVVVPAAQAELKHFESINPQTEASRLARTKLARFFDAKKSVAAHQEFLKSHAASAAAAQVRAGLFAEMARAKQNPKPVALQMIKDIEKDPRLALGLPVALIPAGPTGYELYVKNVRKGLAKADANLAPALLVSLGSVQERFGDLAGAFGSFKQVVAKYARSPHAADAKRGAVRVFERGFFAPGLGQADAEQAFAWRMELALSKRVPFNALAGNVWRVACNPAYRLHGLEDLDALYLYSAHRQPARPNTMADFFTEVYGSYPGDGIGPAEKAENRASPFKAGDRFILYRWALLRAPVDGHYNFWFGGDDYVGLEIDGVAYNIPHKGHGHAGVRLTRGLHVCRIIYYDWGGGYSMSADWQAPGWKRLRLGPEAFSAEKYPLIMDQACANQGAAGLAQWDAYVRKFPRDARGRMMRLETLVLTDPNRAAGELGKLIKRFPGNPHYRERLADCLWRLGRQDEALKHYTTLAAVRTEGFWQLGQNDLWKQLFLRNHEPVSFADECEDRIRARGNWKTWLARAQQSAGDDGAATARVEAAARVGVLQQQADLRQQAVGRVAAGVGKENAAIEAAKALAAKKDAKQDVRAQAQMAIARSQVRIKQLQTEHQAAQRRAQAAQARAQAFRQALGLKADQPADDLFVSFVRSALGKRTLAPGVVFNVAAAVWHRPDKEAVRPLLEYVVKFSADRGQVRWASDRLVELAVAGNAATGAAGVGSAATLLADIGWRAPWDGTHADYLKRSCDLALQSGEVYLFARNAHLLARMHPKNAGLAAYLDRLGEVFEKAGNIRSAEHEYLRIIRAVKDVARTRKARLALARLYQNQGRAEDALDVLAKLVALRMPEDEKKGRKRRTRDIHPAGGGVEAAPDPPAAEPAVKVEDTEALLLATECYLTLGLDHLALDAYERAADQKDFGAPLKPDHALLMQLAGACLDARTYAAKKEGAEGITRQAIPLATLGRAQKALKLIDTLFRFYGDKMTPHQKVEAMLLRADANIMMRNFPRAIEEIRAAKQAAGKSPASLLADLKMGEVHLATDNVDQALPIFKRLAKMNREDVSPLAWFWLGTAQLAVNKRDEAVESFRILWERHAESDLVRRAVYTIARTYAEQGAFLDAIRLYEAVGAINSATREKVIPGDVLTVKVWDADHYLGTGQYTIPVKVTASSGDTEELRLDMNKINHSLFLGTIRTELGEPKGEDGLLQVYGTDLVYVSYEDKFKGLEEGAQVTLETVRGGRSTSLIQVAEDANIKASPTVFLEEEDEEEDIYREKSEEELEEERRLKALSTRLERGEAVVRPGNVVYLRVQDGDLDRSKEPDKVTVNVFTYAPVAMMAEKMRQMNLARAMENKVEMSLGADVPSNGEFSSMVTAAPHPQGRPRLDTVEVELTETGPHTGIFYGTVKTDVNGPTAIASDQSGESIAALAIDGRNNATDAWMGFIDGRPDKWIEVDLKELYDVAKIVWDRGEGADDRFMIDYTITFRGLGTPTDLAKKDNKSAHNNEIVLEKPMTCRWIRFTAHKYEGDAPAISQIQIFDKEGKLIVPPEVSPLDRAKNDVLEFNVGDCMAAEVVDEENIKPARPVTRTSNALGVAYVDGHIDAVYLSRGENDVRGSLIWAERRRGREQKQIWARRTKRARPKDVLQIAVIDPDLDVDEDINSVKCEVISSSGDRTELTAKEIEKTAAIFTARIQLSPSEAAKEDDLRLWVRPGDYVMLRYRDEENRHPGHAVWRESFVFAADDELADFPPGVEKLESPYHAENSIEPPHWTLSLREPDQALPGLDRLEMQALSFATGDRVRFNVLLRNLDGEFSSRVPVGVADKPVVELPKDADPNKPRRLRALDERYYHYGSAGWQRGKTAAFDVPLSVAGDDIVWISYEDETPRVAAGRQFIGTVDPALIENLRKLGVKTDELPDAAGTEGIQIVLRDPFAALRDDNKTREQEVLAEIARKKRHFRKMLAEYKTIYARISEQIDELTKKEDEQKPEPKEEGAPAEVEGEDAPLTVEEDMEGVELAADFMATEDVIRAAALRRDRDGLAEAMQTLDLRLKALERYKTAELEAALDKAEEELRAKLEEQAGKPEEKLVPGPKPPAWYTQVDWWKHCGGIVPGTVLHVRVEDPDLQGETALVTISPLGTQLPQFYEFQAKALADEPGVFELTVPTSEVEETEGGLVLKGVRHLMLTYRDSVQQKFSPKRSSYLSIASNGELRVTGPDFMEAKTDFHLGEDIFLLVNDADMDKTRVRDYVWVDVTSDKGDTERVPVRESQPHSGVFRGGLATQFGGPKANDGILQGDFGGTFVVGYVDELWRSEDLLPPELAAAGAFVKGSDGAVEIFARQLKRGALQRDVLFNTALAEYELGKSSTEMGAVQRGRQHLLESRDMFQLLIEQYPEDPVCAHATYYLGNIHFLLGDYRAAVESLQKVIDRWPKTEFKAMALFKLGTCHLKAQKFDRAVEAFVNLAYHHSDSPLVADAMLILAQHFSKQKLYKPAIGVGDAFIRKFPEHDKTANVYLRLAGWLIMEKQLARAIEVLEQAEKSLPDSTLMPAFLYWHADCIFKTASQRSVQYKKGIILLERITYDYPDSKWAKYAAARLVEVDVDR